MPIGVFDSLCPTTMNISAWTLLFILIGMVLLDFKFKDKRK